MFRNVALRQAVIGLGLIFLVSGCGVTNREDNENHITDENAAARQFQESLKNQPRSEPIQLANIATNQAQAASTGDSCTADGIRRQLRRPSFFLSAATAPELVQACAELYRCSPHAAQALSEFSSRNAAVRIVPVNFDSLPGAAPYQGIRGLYLQGGDAIYLQEGNYSGARLSDICGVLIHELFHFYDLQGHSGVVHLADEFAAHYLENWYLIEIGYILRPGQTSSLTRETLARMILRAYTDMSCSDDEMKRSISGYEPFPGEG